jgi:hypothetical protein
MPLLDSLRSPTQPTWPLEPMFIPKLWINFASFPYILLSTGGCSYWRSTADMGMVRHKIKSIFYAFSKGLRSYTGKCRSVMPYRNNTLSLNKVITGCPSLTKKTEHCATKCAKGSNWRSAAVCILSRLNLLKGRVVLSCDQVHVLWAETVWYFLFLSDDNP